MVSTSIISFSKLLGFLHGQLHDKEVNLLLQAGTSLSKMPWEDDSQVWRPLPNFANPEILIFFAEGSPLEQNLADKLTKIVRENKAV